MGGYTKEWTWDKNTPLIAAARHGHEEIVNFLLSKGANVLASSCLTDDVHDTALGVAEKYKYHSIAGILRRKVEEKNKANEEEWAAAKAAQIAEAALRAEAAAKKEEEFRDNLKERCTQPLSLITLCCDRLYQVNPSGDHTSQFDPFHSLVYPSLLCYIQDPFALSLAHTVTTYSSTSTHIQYPLTFLLPPPLVARCVACIDSRSSTRLFEIECQDREWSSLILLYDGQFLFLFFLLYDGRQPW